MEASVPAADVADYLLSAYGRFIPYHPGRWRILDWAARFIPPTARAREVKRCGFRFLLNPQDFVDRELLYGHVYEAESTALVERTVKPGWTVLDCGAHMGYFTLAFSRAVGREGHVYSFEPCASTYARLLSHLAMNSVTNVEAIQSAISERSGVAASQELKASNTGKNRILAGEGNTPMVSIDEFVARRDLKRLDFLKADVEGFEVRLLRGAEKSIRSLRPVILVELNPEALSDAGTSAGEMLDLLRDFGYSVHVPRWPSGTSPLRRIPIAPAFCNIVALPEE